jgi:U32 family peptidase
MKNNIVKPELLAPAGNLEKLKMAIHYGADAVYIGGRYFSLRANATNFSIDDMKQAVEYAHNNNAKVYVTVNIVFHNEDFKGLEEYLKKLYEIGIDAIIISDPLVIDMVNKVVPHMEIHLSTQASTTNYEAANYWKEKGVKRIVLARETSKEEIKEIIEKTGIDIEVFIHGAMCIACSGRCTLSNYLTLRDSNRGGCSQICRWEFDLDKINNDTKFAMASKDLMLIDHVNELIDINVASFKIEGRMRSIYYIATVVNAYRKVIDKYISTKEMDYSYTKELNRCANRESTSQYFDKEADVFDQYYIGREEQSNQDFLGLVLDYNDEKKEVTIEQRNFFKPGDEVQIFGPEIETINFKIEKIYDENYKELDAARHPQQIIKLPMNTKVYKDNLLRIKFIDNNQD